VKIICGIVGVAVISTLIWFLVIYLSSIHLKQSNSNRITFNEDNNKKST